MNNSFIWRDVRLLPIVHNRVEFALEVRRQFDEFRPDAVTVEFPPTLKEKIIKAVERLPLLSVVFYEDSEGIFVYLPLEPTDPQVEAVRLATERGIPVHFIDRDTDDYPIDISSLPDSYAIKRIGHFLYCDAYLKTMPPSLLPDDILREKQMAYELQRLESSGQRIMHVGGLSHLPGILEMLDRPQTRVIGRCRREGVGLAHLDAESSREVLSEMPFLMAAYERARNEGKLESLDRMELNSSLISLAEENYWKNSKERLTSVQRRILFKFARNYALVTGCLVPSFYQLIVAARGASEDNFAYEVWDKGSEYPWQTENPELPVLYLEGEDLYLDHKKIHFHRRIKSMRRRLVAVPVKKRKREKYPGEWKSKFKGLAICSYPPEDVAIEGYGHYLKKKAIEIKSEGNARVEPFTSSLLDGIDLRETVRNWSEGRIYVRSDRPIRGKVGSVVVIFDPDRPDREGKELFPWCVTWLGEHDQESDMAFYSTPAGEVMDGPGISRCQYGGFMLTYPPMRVYDIWKDPFFDEAGDKPERLLMAAIDYSTETHVVYVAATPPSGLCRGLAAATGKKIAYLPIGAFSPVTLKKLRQFHVLEGHHVRRYAKTYI
ncbi:MAG: hypothetical protein AUK25_01220 [Desulfobacteraceae bacterium CG2_30_51_40]|nr:MAG: hypothetical protein AUK25_01220 [Desulfobacteraceae bacterium CG2_30_51_40]